MSASTPLEINLTAAVAAVDGVTPSILVTGGGSEAGLPSGPFDPLAHRTFDMGLRSFVQEQAGLALGYVEQLYTFGDRGRHTRPGDSGPHVVSVGYLALTRPFDDERGEEASGASFVPWYNFFPWEDWRTGAPDILEAMLPPLKSWAAQAKSPTRGRGLGLQGRLRFAFGDDLTSWDEELVLDRYELLYEAGLVGEARRDGRESALARASLPALGQTMRFDHRRILATAMGRLRAKLKYRPVIFELIDEEFTLTELQRVVEAISGRHLHKQNFRRLVEAAALVEPTGVTEVRTGGRPAQLFRFRHDILAERPAPGLRLGHRG